MTIDQFPDGLEWISALDAYNSVCERNGLVDAARSIAGRAHVGLIRTQAARFSMQQRATRGGKDTLTRDNFELPTEFWWAKGEAALEQTWTTGDFSTWIDQRYQWKAFGVKFERTGIEAMLSPVKDKRTSQTKVPVATKPESSTAKSGKNAGGRRLMHDHPYAAARTALQLMNLPESERDRLTGPNVGATMKPYYQSRANKVPHEDSLDDFGKSILQALKEYWQRK